jgi:hypothetical protein
MKSECAFPNCRLKAPNWRTAVCLHHLHSSACRCPTCTAIGQPSDRKTVIVETTTMHGDIRLTPVTMHAAPWETRSQ